MKEAVIDIDQRMINTLLLHSSFIDNLGLLNGKMGISIFFYHLARKTGNTIYEDYAGELIDEIYEDINLNTPMDFANGLAGIGWGIEYLAQNHFIEANTDEVLEETDKRLMQLIYHIPPDLGLCEGVIGLGTYLLMRIQNPAADDEKIQTLINRQLLVHLISELDRRTQDVSDLIREPSPEHHDNDTSQEVKPDMKQGQPATFDLTWDYPMLLAFLTEVFHLHLYNVKIKDILQRLVHPLLRTENHPQLHSNRLLLGLALTKLNYENINPLEDELLNEQTTPNEFASNVEIEKTRQRLLSGINREIIVRELIPNYPFMKSGTAGISWVYSRLFDLTAEYQFQTEAHYWKKESFKVEETNGLNIMHPIEEYSSILAILEGYAGLMLIDFLP
ncbi:MAG: lanthionine synthetase LanC family protein [Prolixibacteraceae bacterium]